MAVIAASAGFSFLDRLPSLARFVGRAAEEKQDKVLNSALAQQLASTLEPTAVPILNASNLDDFDYQIDLVLMEDRLASADGATSNSDSDKDDSGVLLEALTSTFGVGCAPLLKEAMRLLGDLFDAVEKLKPVSEKLPMKRESTLWFLYDQSVPASVSRGFLDSLRVAVCFQVMAFALLRGIRPEPWVAIALCERLVLWLKSASTTIRALSDDSAMEKEFEDARAAKAAYDSLLEKAKGSGLDVYPPISER